MSQKFRLSTALDVDDLLMECIPYAVKLANEKYKFDPPISISEINRWGKLGNRADVIFEYFNDPEFYKNQPVIKGAKEFVRKLSQMTEVFISTSIPPEFMGIRAKRIMEEFPEIPPTNIYMGSRKDKISTDILFDDGMHNVFKSNASYPVLMRRPWNQSATGMLAVNNYDEFLKLVEVITKSYSVARPEFKEPGILILVGPSGSGKTKVAGKLYQQLNSFDKLISYTTKDESALKVNDWYNYITLEEFNEMYHNGEFFESTMYAGHGYGSRKSDVDKILNQGRNVLCTMDICGAMAVKTLYDNVITVYIKRDRKTLIETILKKKTSNEDKVNRIISIDAERQNQDICDYVVEDTGDYLKCAKDIIDLLNLK